MHLADFDCKPIRHECATCFEPSWRWRSRTGVCPDSASPRLSILHLWLLTILCIDDTRSAVRIKPRSVLWVNRVPTAVAVWRAQAPVS